MKPNWNAARLSCSNDKKAFLMKYAVLGAVLSASLIATALPAFAEPGKGHGKGKHKNEIARLEDNLRSVHFGDDDRERIQEFIVLQERRDCPPGLAKKGNGCLPPGQAKNCLLYTSDAADE